MEKLSFELRVTTKEEFEKSTLKSKHIWDRLYVVTVLQENKQKFSYTVTPNFTVSILARAVRRDLNLL